MKGLTLRKNPMNVSKWFCQSGHFKESPKVHSRKMSHKCNSNKGLFKRLHHKLKRAGLTDRTVLQRETRNSDM